MEDTTMINRSPLYSLVLKYEYSFELVYWLFATYNYCNLPILIPYFSQCYIRYYLFGKHLKDLDVNW